VTDLDRALAAVLHDLEATGAPVPRVAPSSWQERPTAQSAHLRSEDGSEDGSGVGVWVDTAAAPAEQLAMVADQVQEWAVAELGSRGRPTNWPVCGEHPSSHPLEPAVVGGVAVWRCPRSGRPACEVGRLSGRRSVSMSVVPVDERDSSWEDPRPRFRVYLHAGSRRDDRPWTGGATATYDVTGADVLQVIDWAQRQAGSDQTYAVALVGERGGRRGLTWLVGMDGNDHEDPGTPGHRVQRRMLTRQTSPVGISPADRAGR